MEELFLPPIRESASDPHHYTVETPRQRSVLHPECKFDRKKGKGRLRGCLTQNEDFTEWAQHIARVHERVLRQAGIYDAILCTNWQFQRDMRIVSAFLQFRSPSTNTFHLPCGEMSISLWDLSALCGLPVVGEPFDEYLPSNEALKSMVLASSVLDIMSKIRVKGKGKLTYKGWARLFGRISNSKAQRNEVLPEKEEDRGDWDLWLPEIFLNSITPHEELVLFLLLWLSVAVCPSSAHTYSVKPTCLISACQLAEGRRLAIAPRVLCDIYRILGELVTCPTGPVDASPDFPAHFLIGWLGLYFPWIYGVEEAAQLQGDGILLQRFVDRQMANLGFEDVTSRLLRMHDFSQEMYRLPPVRDDNGFVVEAHDDVTEEAPLAEGPSAQTAQREPKRSKRTKVAASASDVQPEVPDSSIQADTSCDEERIMEGAEEIQSAPPAMSSTQSVSIEAKIEEEAPISEAEEARLELPEEGATTGEAPISTPLPTEAEVPTEEMAEAGSRVRDDVHPEGPTSDLITADSGAAGEARVDSSEVFAEVVEVDPTVTNFAKSLEADILESEA